MSIGPQIIHRQNRIIRRFRSAHAVTPEAAVSLDDIDLRQSRVFRRLTLRGVVVDAGQGRFYLSEPATKIFLGNRRRRVLLFVLLGALMMLVVIFSQAP